jgi:hypothetical protein
MKTIKQLIVFLLTIQFGLATGWAQIPASITQDVEDKYESLFTSMYATIDQENIRKGVYYLSQDPLPRRVLNWSVPGHALSSLEEADAWILQQLTSWGYPTKTDETRVRAFGRDFSKPLAHQYAPPPEDSPWYTARNIFSGKEGSENREELILILAHKDSQSWIASPGANDNAVGTCGVLELARVLRSYQPKHTVGFIFCNEEHTPWTSITAAEYIRSEGLKVLAVINMDGIGVKPPEQAGLRTNVTGYTTDEGERLADMMAMLNTRHALGLIQSKYRFDQPGNDDGSFIDAGFPWAVLNIGSIPYGDPNYHTEGDVAEKVDFENARATAQLTLAAILYLDLFGRP